MKRNPSLERKRLDCLIIGGGAAGLSAALTLGRSRRSVLVVDNGGQSNLVSGSSHGLFTRDGQSPAALYSSAKKQLLTYPSARLIKGVIKSVSREGDRFRVVTGSDTAFHARTLLLAQGMTYKLPGIPGLQPMWGKKAWHCPYCDGFESSGKPIVAIGSTGWAGHMSVILPAWSRNISWALNADDLQPQTSERIVNAGGRVIGSASSVSETRDGVEVTLRDKSRITAHSLVVETTPIPRDSLAEQLMCKVESSGIIFTDEYGRTSIDGVFSCGDQSTELQQLSIAAASGHKAAIGINMHLSQMERYDEMAAK